MDERTEFELVADFMVDNGELNGYAIPFVFALGVEFHHVKTLLQNPPHLPFVTDIHEANQKRIEAMVATAGLISEAGDVDIQGWVRLTIKEPDGDNVVPLRKGMRRG